MNRTDSPRVQRTRDARGAQEARKVHKREKVKDNHILTLPERRASVKLPMEERRRRLAEQADRMMGFYNLATEKKEREAWQGGDIVEP